MHATMALVARSTSTHGPAEVDLFEAAPDGILVVDEAGMISGREREHRADVRLRAWGARGRAHRDSAPPRLAEAHVAHRKGYFAQPTRRPMGDTLRLSGRRRTGDEFPVDVSLNYERTSDGSLRAIAFVRDITERRRLEQELRATEENFRLLVESVGDHALMMLDPSGCVITWNPEAERIKGWAADDIIGRHFSVFYLPDEIASGEPSRDLAPAPRQTAVPRTRGGGCVAMGVVSGPRPRSQRCATSTACCVATPRRHRDRTENHQTRARLEALSELNRAALEQRPEDGSS